MPLYGIPYNGTPDATETKKEQSELFYPPGFALFASRVFCGIGGGTDCKGRIQDALKWFDCH
jgi:hypothetical protein